MKDKKDDSQLCWVMEYWTEWVEGVRKVTRYAPRAGQVRQVGREEGSLKGKGVIEVQVTVKFHTALEQGVGRKKKTEHRHSSHLLILKNRKETLECDRGRERGNKGFAFLFFPFFFSQY